MFWSTRTVYSSECAGAAPDTMRLLVSPDRLRLGSNSAAWRRPYPACSRRGWPACCPELDCESSRWSRISRCCCGGERLTVNRIRVAIRDLHRASWIVNLARVGGAPKVVDTLRGGARISEKVAGQEFGIGHGVGGDRRGRHCKALEETEDEGLLPLLYRPGM